MAVFGKFRRLVNRYHLQFVRVFVCICSSLLVCCTCLVPFASASDLVEIPYTEVDTGEDEEPYVQLPANTFLDLFSSSEESDFENVHSEDIIRNVNPVTPSETSGLQSIILSLIGDYDPVVVEHRYTNSQGYTSVTIDIEPDFSWIASCFVFAIAIFCTFKLIGGVICGKH